MRLCTAKRELHEKYNLRRRTCVCLFGASERMARHWRIWLSHYQWQYRHPNINGKLDLSKETDAWKHEFDLDILQAKGPTTRDRFVPVSPGSQFLQLNQQTGNYKVAQRYEASWTSGYKLYEASYVFGNVRYENDEFGAYDNQTVAGIGYGFYVIKEDPTKLLFEIGAGYRRAQKQDEYEQLATIGGTPPFSYVRNRFDKQGDGTRA